MKRKEFMKELDNMIYFVEWHLVHRVQKLEEKGGRVRRKSQCSGWLHFFGVRKEVFEFMYEAVFARIENEKEEYYKRSEILFRKF